MDLTAFFSPAELSFWSEQRNLSQALLLTSMGLKVLFLCLVLLGGVHVAMRRSAESAAGWLYKRPWLIRLGKRAPLLVRMGGIIEKLGSGREPRETERTAWLVDAIFPMLFLILYALLNLPLGFFSTYVLEHERGLATITLGQWWVDWIRSLFLGLTMSAFLGIGLFGLARRLRRSWWIWLWGAVLGALVVWSMLGPMRARMAHDFTPLEEGPLRSSIESMFGDVGFDLEQVEVVDTSRRTKRAGAFIFGEGPTRRVVLSDNLVSGFNPREIVVAVAHELGHHLHEHPVRTWLTTALGALVFLLLCQLVLRWGPALKRLGLKPRADPAALPLILLALQLLMLANNPVSTWLNRREERQADQEALRLTRDPAAFCSLFIRLNRLNQHDPDPPAWIHWYFGHHPTTGERIQDGFEWAERNGMRLGPDALPLPEPPPRKI